MRNFLDYELGEMTGADGAVLKYEVEMKASEHALGISRAVEKTPIFGKLSARLPSERAILYFQYLLKEEILPFVCQACVIESYKRRPKAVSRKDGTVLVPRAGVFGALKERWDFSDAPIRMVDPVSFMMNCHPQNRGIFIKRAKARVRESVGRMMRNFDRPKNFDFPRTIGRRGAIACHYNEGLDRTRRNDLSWHPDSGIDPARIILYFDEHSLSTARPVKEKTIREIEALGFRWVALKKDIIEGRPSQYWPGPRFKDSPCIRKDRAESLLERWVRVKGNVLLRSAGYWRSFYDEFDVKIHYIPDEGFLKNIVQAIAFDIRQGGDGALVGKQRSEVFLPYLDHLGFHPKQVFFVWNKRMPHYIYPNYERMEEVVLSGYPTDISICRAIPPSERPSDILRSRGARFVVTLFDNGYGPDSNFSKNKMGIFCREFLAWALDDPEVGLVIKSKHEGLIQRLESVPELLKRAAMSGNRVLIEATLGKLPAIAAFGADMVVGCGIGTAVMESVIGGCRGIHYDMTFLRGHEFYMWGYGRIIFDDLRKMMDALRRYKANPADEPNLGDWSPFMRDVDYFNDGMGSRRMGAYMKWLMEGFDKACGRSDAIRYASERYAKKWGEDKLVRMGKISGSKEPDARYAYGTA